MLTGQDLIFTSVDYDNNTQTSVHFFICLVSTLGFMSYISHSGYGYSKLRCEDVTVWFLNKFFPRHKIDVEIIHRGLKRENVNGYCDVVGDNYRPRQFLIELDTHMDQELYIKTLLHELIHLRQWVIGSLRFRYGKLCYSKEPVEKYEYLYQPHEIEAREQEEILYHEYLSACSGPVKLHL
jgi:hypothetical protein